MGFPDIAVEELTTSGLAWLFVTYGYTLFFASSLISEGSDLLLLVPAYAGIVGSCVLPVLGAVPDGAIMLFSGLGDLEEAQEQLAVGVGALAGSTIMLLTIPWSLAAFAGRVDVDKSGRALYSQRPKLTAPWRPYGCGVSPGRQVRSGAAAMLLTSISYVVIQGPAFLLGGGTATEVAAGEHWYSLIGLGTTLFGFVAYLAFQVATSGGEHDTKQLRADEIIKRKVLKGELSLAGAMSEFVKKDEDGAVELTSYQTVEGGGGGKARDRLADIVKPFFGRFDKDTSGKIEKQEAEVLLDQLGEKELSAAELFDSFDTDRSGQIDFDEFVSGITRRLINWAPVRTYAAGATTPDIENDASDEEDEIPEDISHLSPSEQQVVIKRRALFKLVLGTALVLVFSDPMVDVMSEIGARTGVPPFYVSFVLAPLASNASELIAAYYYALKKTSKTITISFAALEGAACMNNTFCLSIFMGLIFFRGIAWQYSAETISILLVQFLVALVACKRLQTLADAMLVLSFYPISVAVVYVLENLVGLD
mmetsp:Transcript_5087/g.15387  ORF Transcript_5087/g.15387 Transcript_5087/m.15387 type:complete len:536 (-) Transcript_5087:575-2182(-)